jgi:hypothetical protein
MGGACSKQWKIRNMYKIVIVKTERMRSLARLRHRWEENEVGRHDLGFICFRI